MREHIYDSTNDFHKFYNPFYTNRLSSLNKFTSFSYILQHNINSYYQDKYGKSFSSTSNLYTIYNNYKNIFDNQTFQYPYTSNTYSVRDNNGYIARYYEVSYRTGYPNLIDFNIIVNESYAYIAYRYYNSYPSYINVYGTYIPSRTDYYSKILCIDLYNNANNTYTTVSNATDIVNYSVNNNECYLILNINTTTTPTIMRIKNNTFSYLSMSTPVLGVTSMDMNDTHIYISSTSSNSTVTYTPTIMIIDKSTFTVVRTLTFPRVAVASFAYHIAVNNSKLFMLDASTKVLTVYDLIAIRSGVINVIKTISNLFSDVRVQASTNANIGYYSRINVDNNDNIYVGDYSRTMYDFKVMFTNTPMYSFPTKFDYDGNLISQHILPITLIYPNISYTSTSPSYGYQINENATYSSRSTDSSYPVVLASKAPSTVLSEIMPATYTYEDDICKVELLTNGNMSVLQKGSMPANNVTYWETKNKVMYKHLESDYPLNIPISLVPVNDAPIIDVIDDKVTDEDTPIDITLNYSDEESSMADLILDVSSYDPSMLYYSVSGPTLRLIPVRDKFGSTVVTVRVRDPLGAATTRSFNLTIRPVNDKPVTTNITSVVNEDSVVSINLAGNTVDVDNTSLTYYIVDSCTNGMIVQNNNMITYTPNPNYFGSDTFTFKATDGLEDSNISTCTITVKPVNDAPVFTSTIDDIVTSQSTPITINVSAVDVDNPTISFRASGFGIIGSVDNRNGTLTINVSNVVGSGNINIEAYDTLGLYDRKTVKMTITRRWGDGKLVKTSNPNKITLTSLNYVMSTINLDKNKLNEIYKDETKLAQYYTVNAQRTFMITDYVNDMNEDVLNLIKNNYIDTHIVEENVGDVFSMVLDRLTNTVEFETSYTFLTGEETYNVNSYEKINVLKIKFNGNVFFQVESIVYNINDKEVIFVNKTLNNMKTNNSFSKSNYAVYEKEDGIVYLHRLF